MAELRCEDVAVSYGTRAVLDDIDLDVPAGTLTAVLGASGSGKTTLLRAIMGFVRPERGRIAVGGVVVAEAGAVHLPPERRGVGYVAQEGALYPHLSAGENVAFGLARAERRRSGRVDEVLELVGLHRSDAGRRPHELSGGEQRRVSLARALAPRPRLVLLDEPFSGLDAGLRVETREAVLRALADEGTTAVLVTHDQAEALSMGREVAVLRSGRLIQTDPPETLYRRPADPEVARFVGDAVLLPGILRDGRVRCALGSLPVAGAGLPDGPVEAMVRPEQVEVHRSSRGAAAPEGCGVPARVSACTFLGSDSVVRLDLVDSDGAVTARVHSHLMPEVGELVELAVGGTVVVYPPGPGGGPTSSG
ncbi:MAG: ABC transporter ATP-binding protein [Acidimicrobiales bacterium]|nr:ABC transporter ATP-binding protein [Acidimicrobiales bacterium]